MIINAAKANDAAVILGVELASLTPEVMKTAYRTKAKDCHPDSHDNPEQWARVSWAKECLERWLQSVPASAVAVAGPTERSCRACGGVGRIPIAGKGFGKPMTMQCVMCNGSGEQPNGGPSPHYGRD